MAVPRENFEGTCGIFQNTFTCPWHYPRQFGRNLPVKLFCANRICKNNLRSAEITRNLNNKISHLQTVHGKTAEIRRYTCTWPRPHVLAAFFFPVKIKSARESHFWPFFDFFHGRQHPFHAHFFHFFHAHFLVFTDTFGHFFAFSRALFYFHAHFFFHFFFTGAFFPFHGHFLCFFSRKEKWLSRTLFAKFSRAVKSFHGRIVGFFHGWIFIFTGRK